MTIFQAPFYQNHPVGVVTFTTTGSQSWNVPEDVFFINAVCIGGGGGGAASSATALPGGGGGGGALSYSNNIPVTPGETLTVVVGSGGTNNTIRTPNAGGDSSVSRGVSTLVLAKGGSGANGLTGGAGGVAANGVGDGKQSGGSGGTAADPDCGAGGGAAGYSGTGGAGGVGSGTVDTGSAGSGGAGGGGASNTGGQTGGGGGGGVNVYGQGDSGPQQATTSAGGWGGSGGASGGTSSTDNGATGGLYGGGGGGANDDAGSIGGTGGQGIVSIIWGQERSFPTTNIEGRIGFVTSVVSTSSSITIPSTSMEGDFAFLCDSAVSPTTAPTSVVPSGWDNRMESFLNSSVAMRSIVSTKILTISDINSPILTGLSGSSSTRKTLLIFRPNFDISGTTFTVPGAPPFNNTVETTTPSSQIANPSTTKSNILISHMSSSGSITTRSATGNTTGIAASEIANTTLQYIQYRVMNEATDYVEPYTLSMSDGGTNGLQSAIYAISPSFGSYG